MYCSISFDTSTSPSNKTAGSGLMMQSRQHTFTSSKTTFADGTRYQHRGKRKALPIAFPSIHSSNKNLTCAHAPSAGTGVSG